MLTSVTRADDPLPPPVAAAPTTLDAPTIVTGRVTDVLGHPVADARVHVLSRAGERHTVTTDSDGRYKATVSGPGTYSIVTAIDQTRTFHTVLAAQGQETTLDIEVELDTAQGGEVINIVDKMRPKPKVKAKSHGDPMRTLPYSDEAIDRDAWARAWLLLDIDETGRVTRLKLLKRPGFDLDCIAIDEGFKLTFDPALDAQDRPTKTYVLWSLEWPSRKWLVETGGTVGFHGGGIEAPLIQMPEVPGTTFVRSMSKVPCVGAAPLELERHHRAYRDCSKPDMSQADALPWITRETAEAAVAEIERLQLTEDPVVKRSKVPAIVATGVTGGLVVGFVLSYMRYRNVARKLADPSWRTSVDVETYADGVQERESWKRVTIGFAAASLLSSGASVLLWHRNDTKRSFSVQPTNSGGAAMSYGGSF